MNFVCVYVLALIVLYGHWALVIVHMPIVFDCTYFYACIVILSQSALPESSARQLSEMATTSGSS